MAVVQVSGAISIDRGQKKVSCTVALYVRVVDAKKNPQGQGREEEGPHLEGGKVGGGSAETIGGAAKGIKCHRYTPAPCSSAGAVIIPGRD